MKNYLLTLSVCAVMLTSCSQEDIPEPAEITPYKIHFNCEIPAIIRSRGADANGMFGDATEIDYLQYAIYDNGELYFSSRDEDAPQAKKEPNGRFSLTLIVDEAKVKNNSYDVFFWADAWGEDGGSPYTLDYAVHTVTVDYDKSLSMYDKADAFAYYGPLPISEENNFYVTLYRPAAQINIVTPEFNKFNAEDESHMIVGFALQDDSGQYYLPNEWDYKANKYSNKYYGTQINKIPKHSVVPTSERITINGNEMRYLFVGYIFPRDEQRGTSATVVTSWDSYPESMLAHSTSSFFPAPHWRYFLYPKDSDENEDNGFMTNAIDVSVENYPGFYSTSDIIVNK